MIRVRAILTNRRCGLLVASAVVLLSVALAWAHGAPGDDHMGGGHDGDGAMVSMCLAVIQAVGSVAVVALLGAMVLARRRRVALLLVGAGATGRVVGPQVRYRARAGPEVLQVFLR